MKKLALLLPLLCLSAHAKPTISQNEVLKIFEVSGLGGQEFENDDGFSKEFNSKDLSLQHCLITGNEKLCATTYIASAKDINGDKQPEILVIDKAHSTYHYGNTAIAFALLTKTSTGYRLIADSMGIPNFLKTKGKNGYPDLEIGGPGFCFTVLRYNGTDYQYHRHEYEGKACE